MNKTLLGLIRPHYRTLQGYVSAGMESAKDAEKIFMNANENPYALPGLEGFNRYPEPQPAALLAAYAALYGAGADNIVMTRGADEAIVVLTDLFCEPHRDNIVLCPPTFGMYARDANAMPAGILNVPLRREDGKFTLDVDGIIAAGQKAKLVFICSPNNPTGNCFARADILRICAALAGKAAVIADETYIEFTQEESLVCELARHPNLIVLRTLSKSYALAGMRMGTLISGDTDFIALIRAKCLDAYPLPIASVEAALKVMTPENLEIAAANRKKLLAERDRIRAAFKASPLVTQIYPSDANFLFIEMQGAGDFVKFCEKHKVILRDFSNKPGTENCIRISPGLPDENDTLLVLLKHFTES
jgi:histidinol-phosphate aminotransferase